MLQSQRAMAGIHSKINCIIARGSLSETYNHLIDALDWNYINTEQLNAFKIKIDETERLLNGYIAYLRKKL